MNSIHSNARNAIILKLGSEKTPKVIRPAQLTVLISSIRSGAFESIADC
jgi:hypothetical protein